MSSLVAVLPYAIGLCLAAVVITLFTGLAAMSGGDAQERMRSNRLMRWRVGLQALTIALLLLYVALTRW